MLLIACPWCGPRPEQEFVCAGEVHPARPGDPASTSDRQWSDHVVMRANRRGVHEERWWHARGCGSWLSVMRDTLTHDIHLVSLIGKGRS
ncbi:MAG: sarcosine oxidase subunit delta [Hyphomicrobiales bacterium]|nr:sarcosine oxidase subunit delta [Hyphomicrobiales bacterium]